MNELKPVAWHTEDHTDDYSATTYYEEVAGRWKKKGWSVTPMYYAIPDTHRVVSVELLKRMLPGGGVWNLSELRAIIDKEQS